MAAKGAQAALMGYRLQALYILWSILFETDTDIIFQPEGAEDLSIFKSVNPVKSIQIKAHRESISLTSFSPKKKESFFHRCAALRQHSEIIIEVVSFGDIGPEIKKAWENSETEKKTVSNKFINYGFKQGDIDFFFSNIKWKSVDEEKIKREIISHLQFSPASGEPTLAFDLLTAWLYQASEERTKITRQDLINKINQVGKYIADRMTHHGEWFTTIRPFEEKILDTERKTQLAEEFKEGVSVRYEHIIAGLDAIRPKKLQQIQEAFSQGHKVVIVHGASGQGKTALALRYFKDYLPHSFRYSIAFVAGRVHASRVATALAGHHRAVKADLYLHLDVTASDQEWDGLLKDLSSEPNIKVLLTIRQEDLARTNLSNAEHGSLASVDLSFDQNEARSIYHQINQKKTQALYPDFQEAWRAFGSTGPLLEFVYYLTHAQTLKERLAGQVNRLREEVRRNRLDKTDLEFLRICVVATAYQARVNLKSLADALGLKEPVGTLKLFEKEYFIRQSEDGIYVDAMHPIRSKMLADLLCDTALSSWLETAKVGLDHLSDSDLHAFLLYAFSRRSAGDIASLLAHLNSLNMTSWTKMAGCLEAILWFGLKNYLAENSEVLSKAKKLIPGAAEFILDFDVAQAMPGKSIGLVEVFKETNADLYKQCLNLRKKQTSKENAFKPLRKWLQNISFPTVPPKDNQDWVGLAIVLFWAARLSVVIPKLPLEKDFNITNAIDGLTIKELALLVCATKMHIDTPIFTEINRSFNEIIHRFVCEKTIIHLEYDEVDAKAYFIVDHIIQEGDSDKINIHQQALVIVNLLSLLFTEKDRFVCCGFGHRLKFLMNDYDETEKAIPKENLPHEWLTSVNSTLLGLADLDSRPDDWPAYVARIMLIRKNVIEALEQLPPVLNTYFTSNHQQQINDQLLPSHFWDQARASLSNPPSLPKCAVDEWGFEREGKDTHRQGADPSAQVLEKYHACLVRYLSFHRTSRDIFSNLNNFFNQSNTVLSINPLVGRKNKHVGKKKIARFKRQCSYNNNTPYLSVHNLNESMSQLKYFQNNFRKLFGQMIDPNELTKLEKREVTCYQNSCPIWYKFAMQPHLRQLEADHKFPTMAENILNKLRKNIISGPVDIGSGDKCNIVILNESKLWKGETAIWLKMDVSYPPKLLLAYSIILKRINKVIGQHPYRSFAREIAQIHWRNIIIVPTFGQNNFHNKVWQIPTVVLDSRKNIISEERAWLFFNQNVSEDTLKELGVEVSSFNIPDVIERIANTLGELFSQTQHLSDFNRISDVLGSEHPPDDFGDHVLNEYILENGKDISQIFKQYNRVISELSEHQIMDDKVEHDENMLAARESIVALNEKAIPDKLENGSTTFSFKEVGQWADNLAEATDLMLQAELFLIASYLENIADDSDDIKACKHVENDGDHN